MAWLRKQNSDICWDSGVGHWGTHTNEEDRLINLVSAGPFIATMHAEYMHGYELHLHELGLDPGCDTA
jgi:hypothetical protein